MASDHNSDIGPPPQHQGFISALVYKILRYADRPWRAAFVVIIIVLGATGYIIYDQSTKIIELIASQKRPTTLRSSIELAEVISDIFPSSSGSVDAVAIWAVNLGSNTAQYRVGRRRDGTPWIFNPPVVQWIHPKINTAMLAKLMRGDSACAMAYEFDGALSGFLVADGIKYVCYIPEPPSNTEIIIGFVVLGWRTVPLDHLVLSALAVVHQYTPRIVR